ncbi:hypothetical protein CU665_05535 [Pseudomonas syringae pv. actinidifoliorum]|nr:hypothetical protein [Pseudomonas syringae pv. actinidifoliorum]NAT22348.1 hypothetical protein [Pseudomonas syringae pv. actinidifoliorum]
MNLIIRSLDVSSSRFKKALGKLPDEIKSQAKQALKDLKKNPQPGYLKLEKLNAYSRPSIYTIHFTGNNSHKMSFEMKSDIAVMRNVGTHKLIDRTP